MASDASDVQVCVCKLLKLASSTCLTLALKYPYHSLSSLCLFLLYMIFPLVFWVLVYSFPPFVCVTIVISVLLRRRNVKREEAKKEEKCSERRGMFAADNNVNRRSFNRVHSVRQRRAKDIATEDNSFQDKNAVSSTNIINDILVDKKALKEESPKEIREVEVQHYNPVLPQESTFPSSDSQKPLKNDEFALKNTFQRLKALDQEEEDSRDTKTDIGIPDTYQRNKRLESLIARRRSRKIMDSEVRRTMMKMDKSNTTSDHGQIASLIIPKNNAYNSFVPGGAFCRPYSPGPDSAPSVLVPMRNPFDLPYDPQEEKPDLTDHSFKQEFMTSSASNHNNRDIIFCRHESFSLGGSMNQNRGETALVHDPFGLRQRDSSNKECEPTTELPPHNEPPKSNSNSDNDPHDQIKEIIQVHENGTDHMNHGNQEVIHDHPRVQTVPGASNSAASNSTSDEDEPVYTKIDKEAILKSLSSMARRHYFQEMEDNNNSNIINNDQIDDSLNYAWCADRALRNCHHPSYSIASDMQVELSEVSSPPLTIDEFCFQDDNYQDISSWESDPDFSNNAVESRPALDNPAFRLHDSKEHETSSAGIGESSNASNKPRKETSTIEPQSIVRSAEDLPQEMVQSSTNRARNGPQPTPSSNDPQTSQTPIGNEGLEEIPAAQGSYLSPKSVLHPTFSLDQLSSYDRDTDEDFQQVNTQTPQVSSPREAQNTSVEQPTTLQNFDVAVGILQGSSEPSSSSAAEAINKQKIHENGTKPGEGASSSSSHNSEEVSNDSSLPEQKELSEVSSSSTTQAINSHEIEENRTKSGEVASSNSQVEATPTEQLKPLEENNSSSSNNDSKISNKNLSLSTDQKDSSVPSTVSASNLVNDKKIHENGAKAREVADTNGNSQMLAEGTNNDKESSKDVSLSTNAKESTEPRSVSPSKQTNHENETKPGAITNDEDSSEKAASTNDKGSSELTSISGGEDANKQKIHDKGNKEGEVGGGNSGTPTKLLKPTEEPSTSSGNNHDKISAETSSVSTNQKQESSEPTLNVVAAEEVNKQKIDGDETKQGEFASGSSPINGDKVSNEKSPLSIDPKESSNTKQKIHDNGTKPGEIDGGSSQSHEAHAKPMTETSTGSSNINIAKISSDQKEPFVPSNACAIEYTNEESTHENGAKSGEGKPAEPLKTIEETSISSFKKNDANSSEKLSQATGQEEPSKRLETTSNYGTKSSKEGDQRENSDLHKDTVHERCSDKPTNNQETLISRPVLVEDNDKKNQHDIKGKEDGEKET